MKKAFLFLTAIMIIGACVSAQAQCPTQYDSGICDSLILEPYKVVPMAENYPVFATVEILVSHDIVSAAIDSIGGFVVPLAYTSSNVAAFCSTSLWWNGISILDIPNQEVQQNRSIFRHLPSMQDIQIHNRMLDMNADFVSGWDFIVLELGDEVSRYWFTAVPTGTMDERWGDGNRVLLATMTFLVGDSTEICIDTNFWPPASQLAYSNSISQTYIPEINLPLCFYVKYNDVRELHGSDENRPSGFSLAQNYPNPFNPVTNIAFTVARTAQVRLDVYNVVGQKVKTLVDQEMKPGAYAADWDGTDQSGKAVSSGIYFYRMEAGDFAGMKKMLLLK
jgi:hypothetical protein